MEDEGPERDVTTVLILYADAWRPR